MTGRLRSVNAGDILEVKIAGTGRFYALVTAGAPLGRVGLRPLDATTRVTSCRPDQVVGHWSANGAPVVSDEPRSPSPRQLQLGT